MTQKLRKEDFEFGELTSKTFPGGPQTSLELVGNRSVFILDLRLINLVKCVNFVE